MKYPLSRLFKHFTLGENLNSKFLTQWLNELSHAFHFLLSSWQPAYSYGQTQASTRTPRHLLQMKATNIALQDQQISPSASTRKKTQTSKSSLGNGLTTLAQAGQSLDLSAIKLRVFNGLYTFWENKRLRWGMLLLLIAAPLVKFTYLLFPVEGFGEYFVHTSWLVLPNGLEGEANQWYWGYIREYVFSNGELLAPVISVVGIFLLFPKNYYPSYLVGVPFGYYLSLSIHRMFFVSDYSSFHANWSASTMSLFLILGVVAFVISDKVLFRKNHRQRATEARIIGLINMPGLDWEDKEPLIKKETKELMKMDNELFVKETA